jgi:hypothetical protein
MDLVIVRLAAGPEARNRLLSPETLVDVLWAAAVPADQLEHVRARQGPDPGSVDAVLFHLPADTGSTIDVALRLCRRALLTAPSLSGWTLTPLSSTTDAMNWEIL